MQNQREINICKRRLIADVFRGLYCYTNNDDHNDTDNDTNYNSYNTGNAS